MPIAANHFGLVPPQNAPRTTRGSPDGPSRSGGGVWGDRLRATLTSPMLTFGIADGIGWFLRRTLWPGDSAPNRKASRRPTNLSVKHRQREAVRGKTPPEPRFRSERRTPAVCQLSSNHYVGNLVQG
jgi:hypothetical protein